MPLTNDILLNGLAYSVVPGSYRKRNAPATAAVNPRDVRRIELGPFRGGQRQALDEQDGAGWDSSAVGPAFDGQGVEPFPNVAGFADALLDVPSTTSRAYGVIAGSNAFIGIGRRIYKSVLLTNGTWAALTAAADFGAGVTISGLAYYHDDLLVMLSTGQDIRKFNTTTNSLSVWRTGEKAQVGVGYAGQLIYAPKLANAQEELRLSGTKWNGNAVTHFRYLDSPILRMAAFAGKVAIATRKSLYFMGGQPYPGEADDATVTADTSKAPAWIGDPQPVMTHGSFAEGDDFVFLESYRGRLYTWLGGRVAEYDDSQEQGRWLRIGPEGVRCYGAAVAGDWLVVAVESRYGLAGVGAFELWGFNGEGWWLLGQRTAAPAAIWPCPLAGAGNRDLIVFRDGLSDYDLYRLVWRSTTLHTYAGSGSWTSSLLDGGDPTRDKAWQAVGAVFAAPAYRGLNTSSDGVIFPLEYSIDCGVSWTVAVSQNSGASGTRGFTREAVFGTVFASRYLQLRVRWSSVSVWAPVLTALWAEYSTLDNAGPRRRWELVIDAGDRSIRRDSQVDSQSGRQKIAALWAAWQARTTLVFKDVDNDTDAIDWSVRIEEIEEKVAKPSDGARWGESQVALTLVQAGGATVAGAVTFETPVLVIVDGGIDLPLIPANVDVVDVRIVGESAPDDLASIAVTGALTAGTLMVLRTNTVDDVTVLDAGAGATGGIQLVGDVNCPLLLSSAGLVLEWNGTVWLERARWA